MLATQNPIEQEGTYPLPEAQLDRFMLSSTSATQPRRGAADRQRHDQAVQEEVQPILSGRDLVWIQQLVREVPASDHWSTTPWTSSAPPAPRARRPGFISDWLAWGAGPRAAQYIVLAAKARAILHGRLAVSAEDIRAVARPVLRHRIFTNFNADAEGVDADQIIDRILKGVTEPSYGERVPRRRREPGREARIARAK